MVLGRRTDSTSPKRSCHTSCPSLVSPIYFHSSSLCSSVVSAAHSSNAIRQAAAKSIAAGIDAHPVQVADAIAHLIEEYRLKVSSISSTRER